MRIKESQLRAVVRSEIIREGRWNKELPFVRPERFPTEPVAPAFLPDGWSATTEFEYSYDSLPAVVVYWDFDKGTWILADYHNKTPFESAEHAISYVIENEDDPNQSWNWG
jgi:hypothetical protein